MKGTSEHNIGQLWFSTTHYSAKVDSHILTVSEQMFMPKINTALKFISYFHKTYLNSTIYYSQSLEVLNLYSENAEHLVLTEVLKLLTSPSILQINLWTCLKSVTGDIKFWWNKGTFWIIFENKRKHARLEIGSLA